MTEVVTIKFNNCGKSYFFAPQNGLKVNAGDKVIVETSRGIEMADCVVGNRQIDDSKIVQPLRFVTRIATKEDIKQVEENKVKEKEAYKVCQQKIKEHELDMKLVSTECGLDGNKISFYFTSEGRVDFRDLVKDLAAIFHTRIELRQIGVRDEARMIGGLGICGRPYCCGQFLDDFAPVSTKMAKVQNLSLNPTKISGSCGRLMCCLRYEEDAYEDLLNKVPKQGAYVETPDGFGTVINVDLLREKIKVTLDSASDDTSKTYTSAQVATVPGGKPTDGKEPQHILNYDPSSEREVVTLDNDSWKSPSFFAEPEITEKLEDSTNTSAQNHSTPIPNSDAQQAKKKKHYKNNRHRYYGKHNKGAKKPNNQTNQQ